MTHSMQAVNLSSCRGEDGGHAISSFYMTRVVNKSMLVPISCRCRLANDLCLSVISGGVGPNRTCTGHVALKMQLCALICCFILNCSLVSLMHWQQQSKRLV